MAPPRDTAWWEVEVEGGCSEFMQAVCAEEILPPSSCTLGSANAFLKLMGGQIYHLERTLSVLPVEALEQLAVACEASIVSFWMLVGGGSRCPLKVSLEVPEGLFR